MAGVLQKFTRGPVHEHVNVEPEGVPVVTVPNVRHFYVLFALQFKNWFYSKDNHQGYLDQVLVNIPSHNNGQNNEVVAGNCQLEYRQDTMLCTSGQWRLKETIYCQFSDVEIQDKHNRQYCQFSDVEIQDKHNRQVDVHPCRCRRINNVTKFGGDFKEVSVSDDADARMKAFHRNLKGTRIKSLAVTLQVVLSRRVFETIKIRRRLQKFLSAYEYIQMIGGISSPGASYPNGSKGHPRNREARFLCPQATYRHPTCIRRALYDHVDLVIAIAAIYLDPRYCRPYRITYPTFYEQTCDSEFPATRCFHHIVVVTIPESNAAYLGKWETTLNGSQVCRCTFTQVTSVTLDMSCTERSHANFTDSFACPFTLLIEFYAYSLLVGVVFRLTRYDERLNLSHLPSQTILFLLTRRKRGIFPFTFYSGKQGGILVAVQTRSPIARGNWVDIGNESKEQITWSKGWRVLFGEVARPTSGVGGLRRGLCARDGSRGIYYLCIYITSRYLFIQYVDMVDEKNRQLYHQMRNKNNYDERKVFREDEGTISVVLDEQKPLGFAAELASIRRFCLFFYKTLSQKERKESVNLNIIVIMSENFEEKKGCYVFNYANESARLSDIPLGLNDYFGREDKKFRSEWVKHLSYVIEASRSLIYGSFSSHVVQILCVCATREFGAEGFAEPIRALDFHIRHVQVHPASFLTFPVVNRDDWLEKRSINAELRWCNKFLNTYERPTIFATKHVSRNEDSFLVNPNEISGKSQVLSQNDGQCSSEHFGDSVREAEWTRGVTKHPSIQRYDPTPPLTTHSDLDLGSRWSKRSEMDETLRGERSSVINRRLVINHMTNGANEY
ncbi:hypothetical protein EAG_16120 [Camponotus floridanus]|uniref:Uncharacterized protein n=1 Tax=Camponotus floridanus TaxID=104421 RepID=E2AM31_CAMFO|nr:hypothetical protein EAG_16120 [Camponotus floridanus]